MTDLSDLAIDHGPRGVSISAGPLMRVSTFISGPSGIEAASVSSKHLDLSLLRLLLAAGSLTQGSEVAETQPLSQRKDERSARILKRLTDPAIHEFLESNLPGSALLVANYLKNSPACARVFDLIFDNSTESSPCKPRRVNLNALNINPIDRKGYLSFLTDAAKLYVPSLAAAADIERTIREVIGVTTVACSNRPLEKWVEFLRDEGILSNKKKVMLVAARFILNAAQTELADQATSLYESLTKFVSTGREEGFNRSSAGVFCELYSKIIDAADSLKKEEARLWGDDSWLGELVANIALLDPMSHQLSHTSRAQLKRFDSWRAQLSCDLSSSDTATLVSTLLDPLIVYPDYIPEYIRPATFKLLTPLVDTLVVLRAPLALELELIDEESADKAAREMKAKLPFVDLVERARGEKLALQEIVTFWLNSSELPESIKPRLKEIAKLIQAYNVGALVGANKSVQVTVQHDLSDVERCKGILWNLYQNADGRITFAAEIVKGADPNSAIVKVVVLQNGAKIGPGQKRRAVINVRPVTVIDNIYAASPIWKASELSRPEPIFNVPPELRIAWKDKSPAAIARAKEYLLSIADHEFFDHKEKVVLKVVGLNDRGQIGVRRIPGGSSTSTKTMLIYPDVIDLAYSIQWGELPKRD